MTSRDSFTPLTAITGIAGDKSLALDAKHAQTLFNVGIVKRDAKNDPKGAIDA